MWPFKRLLRPRVPRRFLRERRWVARPVHRAPMRRQIQACPEAKDRERRQAPAARLHIPTAAAIWVDRTRRDLCLRKAKAGMESKGCASGWRLALIGEVRKVL